MVMLAFYLAKHARRTFDVEMCQIQIEREKSVKYPTKTAEEMCVFEIKPLTVY